MANSHQLYYKLFEKIVLINNNNGKLGKKVINKLMAVYKYISKIASSKEVKKRMEGKEDKKYIRLRQFKDKHTGKRCFIVCTGPSLTVDDINKLKDEYTFGMNSVVKMFDKTEWRPTYYVISDSLVYKTLSCNSHFKAMKNKFISSDIEKREEIDSDDITYYVDGYELFKKGHAVNFSDDIYVKVYAGGTVTYDIMQIAAYMGFKEIYLLGCDSDYSGKKKHFDEYLDDNSKLKDVKFNVNRNIEAYKVAKAYCDTHDTKIYNATRGGNLEVFPRVDFDSLFDKNE